MTKILYTCHEGCDARIWDWCGPGIRDFAELRGAQLVELPKSLLRNPQWVLFDAMRHSVANGDADAKFAWVDSDIVVREGATDIWAAYPDALTVCPKRGHLNDVLLEALGLPSPTPDLCTGVVRWGMQEARVISDWVDANASSLPKVKANRSGDLGDQEVLLKAIHETGLSYKTFHPRMHVAGAHPPVKTAFKHKGGGSKVRVIPRFLKMNEDYASRPDPYSTHLEVLAEHASGVAVEFGCGKYSTPLLIQKCDSVLSVEMQDSGWLEEVRGRVFNDYRWTGVEALGAFTFLGVQYPDHIDVGFVDGHGASRFACVNFLMRLGVKTIIAHDTERPGYQWDLIVPDGYTSTIHKEKTPWTTVWTKDAPK